VSADVAHWDDPGGAPVLCAPAACNGLGLDAWQTWAFWRAGLSPFEESPFRCPNGRRATMAPCRTLPLRSVGAERLLALLEGPLAAAESAVRAAGPSARVLLALGIGDRFSEGAAPAFVAQYQRLQAALSGWLAARWGSAALMLVPHGNAAFATVCLHAGRYLASGQVDLALVGAVDTAWDPPTVDALLEAGRLFDLEDFDSCIPGEGAAVFAMATARAARRYGLAPVARVASAACAVEPASMGTDEPCAGDGLAAALRAVTQHLKARRDLVPWVLGDVTNERYRTHEWGLALPRALAGGGLDTGGRDFHALFDDDLAVDFLPECFGDLGAATMATAAVIAAEAFRRGDPAAGACLAVGSAASIMRGALLLRACEAEGAGG